MVVRTVTNGFLGGTGGNDSLAGIAQNGTGQIHAYAKAGNDTLHLDFANITKFSHGHHVRGDSDGTNSRGADTFNFRNLHKVDDTVVGRIEDFDPSRDNLSINGSTISLGQFESGSGTTGGFSWRIVEYDVDSRDSASDTQQWILIDTGQGSVFYALEGARVTNENGASNGGEQEAHFIGASGGHRVTASELDNLPTVGYVDSQNHVPSGYTAQGGITINDYDDIYADVQDPIDGTSSGDLIAAGLNDDYVHAGSGNDRVWGGSGNDTIYAGNGSDTLLGGHGDDVFHGGWGADSITGGAGDDLIYGGAHYDTIHSGDGADTVWGGWGRDLVYLNQGDDIYHDNTQSGVHGQDTVFGGHGADTLLGGHGDDVFRGGWGADSINGGLGDDRIFGGTQYDTIHSGDGADSVWGGNGRDLVYLNQGDDIYHDNAQGGVHGQDTVFGGYGHDKIQGGGGDDKFHGQWGDDLIYGGRGDDRLYGENGNDLLNGGPGSDTATGGSGTDTFEFKPGDLIDWNDLSGSWADKNDQLDLVTDFTIGQDRIEFDGFANANSMSDLLAWKTTIDGNVHFTVQVRSTNERILVDVDDSTSWSQFFDSDNFLFA